MCVFLQKIGCTSAIQIILIAFDLHDNLGLHYWRHLSNYINLRQNGIAQKTTHE